MAYKHQIDGHHTYTISGLQRKREELQALRRKLFNEIKAIERDIALVGNCLRLFDPDTYTKKVKAGIAKKRPKIQTRREAIAMLRDSAVPLTSREMAEIYMARNGIDATDKGELRSYCSRFAAACYNMHRQGITQQDSSADVIGWRIKPDP